VEAFLVEGCREVSVRVLVTGATGFIGERSTRLLAEQGHEVVAASRSAEQKADRFGAGVTPRSLDITDPGSFGDAFEGVDAVVHTAAMVGDWGAREDFMRFAADGTRAVVDAARAAGVPRFVHVSSIAVYRLEAEGAVPETSPRRDPDTCPFAYAAAKSAAEGVVEEAREGGYDVVIVRPGNVYGPGSVSWTDRVAETMRMGLAAVPRDQGPSNTVYVDNVCALLAECCVNDAAAGQTFNAVDLGVQPWSEFFGGYAEVVGKRVRVHPPGLMLALASLLEGVAKLTGRPPMLTRMVLAFFRFQGHLAMDHAQEVLGWSPPISAAEGMKRTQAYLVEKFA
jgi:nucleoside-diphosphate-sugar epimerase